MTIREAVISELGFAPGNALTIDKAIIDQSLTGSDTYAPADHKTAVLSCALAICRILYSTADVTTSANGVVSNSIKYDRENLHKRIVALETELGIIGRPKIISKNVW